MIKLNIKKFLLLNFLE